MDKDRKNIVVLEPSKIVYEGLTSLILKSDHDCFFFHTENINDIEIRFAQKDISVVFINPITVLNRLNEFARIRNHFPDIYWIGIIYSFYDSSVLSIFNDTFLITEDISVIIKKINKICKNDSPHSQKDVELTEREKDVLKWLVTGFSNKETSNKLNISIHTVNTHRKNIMDKTGIRSMSGLTIYAVTKKIISLD